MSKTFFASKFILKIKTFLFKKKLRTEGSGGLFFFYVNKLKNKRGTGRFTKSILKCLGGLTLGFIERAGESEVLTSADIPKGLFYSNQKVTLHDLVPLVLYNKFSNKKLRDWVYVTNKFLKLSDVYSVSKSSALTIAKYYSQPINKLKVLFNGNTKFPVEVKPYGSPSLLKNYWFFLGTLDHNKNMVLVLKTFQSLNLNKINLKYVTVIGKGFKVSGGGFINFKFVSDLYLKLLLLKSSGSLFLSLYEGFGMPPVEAGFIGKRNILSSRPSLLEVNKKLQVFVDPLSIYELSNVLTFMKRGLGFSYCNYYSFFL